MNYYHKPNPKYDKIIKMVAQIIFGGLVVVVVFFLEICLILQSPDLGIMIYEWMNSDAAIPALALWSALMVVPCAVGLYAMLFPCKFAKLGRSGHVT